MVGKNMYGFRDVIGKPSVKFMIDQVTQSQRKDGWVHYLWPVPGKIEPKWKSTYVHLAKGPNNKKYVVAMGIYDVPTEPCFVAQQVDNAVRLLQAEGLNGFGALRDRLGPFIWKDAYVYVFGYDGIMYVNPGKPLLEGINVIKLMDESGVKPFVEMLEAAEPQQGRWVEYFWPKPAEHRARKKHAYVKRISIDGKDYVVGCGLYLAE